ncbi:3',5'-nucleoside bisphosphate phosphatase [Burkholderia glumae]|uniref:PHP domain-containing protein n=1 Tax=Burkholderia glumae TaxID=337 RepID=A0AAP9Y2K3_BURGL|nr:3',5'-nucleoside bisphosphate phosphatase [Burkholderia glumae]ACR29522.1 PHP-like protein [Burkholderia glumae BGR1]AJY65731.1 PHP domain protein [Burkholderia glumae LMG 2196 = ATCC 33617]KHJ62805.1 phosphoesterase [Burkholderia glumae]MCM2548307.1 PHP domain-containing protein [Burkholderia glumae]MCR1768439.1 PHP domain-containing protein [Burkholderia glumae]
MNADLHCHSNVSDGHLAPAEVARRAQAAGVTLWALTDHDEVGGQLAAREAAEALGMRYLSGVEISVTWASRTVHVVGLHIDPANPALVDGLCRTRNGRAGRAREMAEQLAAIGIPGAYEGALRHVSNPDLISRTHFARFLVEAGYAASTSDVFARYLGDGKPGFVPHRWATLADAVGWIRAAGGEAVIAHPGRYSYTPVEFDALFGEFIDLGGRAIEVVTGSHTPDQYRQYADVARRYGFEASRGSDFHAPGESVVEFGSLPPLPPDLTPVWERWL